jgi:hypothetical protein
MNEGDTPLPAGPQTIEDRLDAVFAAPEKDKPEPEPKDVTEAEEAAPEADAEGEAPEADAKPDEPETPSEDEEAPQVLTIDEYGDVIVEVDGQRTTLKDLHKGTLRQADYSRKTQELAEQRKALEAKQAEIAETERRLQAALAQAQGEEQEPDWDKVFEEDPLEAPRLKHQWEKKQAARAQARQQMAEQEQRRILEFRAQTAAMAVEKFPEWKEPEAYAKGEAMRRKAALHAGFTEAEYNNAHDMRLAVLLELAAKGMEKVDAAATAEKRVAKAPTVLKPGATKSKAEREQAEKAAIKRKLAQPQTVEQRLQLLGL